MAIAAKAVRLVVRPQHSAHHMLYGPTHQEIRKALSELIEKEINPHVDEWERKKHFPARVVFKKLGQLGAFGVNKPTEYGGLGLDFSYSVAVAETMGQINCAAIPMAAEVQSDMATPALAEYGSDYLKREFLAPSMSGNFISCLGKRQVIQSFILGVSEPNAGSDVAAIRTYARRHHDDLLITGVTRGRNIEKLGMHCSDTAEIFFDNVRVPIRNIIGEEGRGFFYQMSQFQHERLVAVAVLLAPLENIINSTMEYAKERQIFGQSELSNQVIRYQLAEMRVELESVRSLLYRAVLEKLKGEDVTVLASMAKFKSARLARSITDNCLQFWGGNGYTWDNVVSRFYRDLRLFSIAGGCDEVMLSIISRHFESKM